MRNKISLLTLAMLGVVTISSFDAEARKPKSARFKGVKNSQQVLKATNPATSTGLVDPATLNSSRSIVASDCLAGTFFNGTACAPCATGTYSGAGASSCTSCGDNVASCDGATGTVISCADGFKLEGGACVVDPNASTSTSEDVKFKDIKQKYALQLAEVTASCSGIADALETIKNLNATAAVSSDVGIAAAGTATVTSIIKANKDEKAINNSTKDYTEKYNTWLEKVKAAKEKLVDPAITNEDFNAVVKETKELAKEVNKKYKGLNDREDDKEIAKLEAEVTKYEAAKDYDLEELAKSKTALESEANGEEVTEERKAKIPEEIADIDAKIADKNAYDEAVKKLKDHNDSQTEKNDASKGVVVSALDEMSAMSQENYTQQQSANTNTKGLGIATTAALGTATLTSGVATGTSFAAKANAEKIVKKIEECNARLEDLKIIAGKIVALGKVDEEAQTAHDHALKVVGSCSINKSAVNEVKNLTNAGGIVSAVGTATGGAGTVTSAFSNSDKRSADAKKKLNTATAILAGVTTGTSGATAITAHIAWGKIDPVIDNAKKCEEALRENMVDVDSEWNVRSISYDGKKN